MRFNTVAERQAHQKKTQESFAETLRLHNAKKLEQQKEKQKKKSTYELSQTLRIHDISHKAIRPKDEYVAKSYNLDKQVIGLINHLFVKYPVPAFLYNACRQNRKEFTHKFDYMSDIYRQWFVTLAQGGSFRKTVQSVMTAKEASVFLSGPYEQIHENVWYARMKVAGMADSLIYKLMDRIFGNYCFGDNDTRMAEVIRFYVQYGLEMDKDMFGEVTDFVVWRLRADRDFSFKGRTLNSVLQLSNEWHAMIHKAKAGSNVAWPGLGFPDWIHEQNQSVWAVVELRNNKELMNEGRKQKHCVYSYVYRCADAKSFIFSLRGYHKSPIGYDADGNVLGWHMDVHNEFTRITVEVNSFRNIVQVRGLANRLILPQEKDVLRRWAAEKGLQGRI